ncbi:hypothetical protein HAX54_012187, partial [Datura stramonium]|nr:hypothetical protein [Datura stramonium]
VELISSDVGSKGVLELEVTGNNLIEELEVSGVNLLGKASRGPGFVANGYKIAKKLFDDGSFCISIEAERENLLLV